MNKLIVCNMKMNLTKQEIDSYLEKLQNQKLSNVIFCPTSLYIPYFINDNLKVGIQNISRYEEGFHTGQVSIKQVSSMDIKYAIIGHSETKNDLEEINEKIDLCSKYGVTPILCIGESKKLDLDSTKLELEKQLNEILINTKLNKLIIAYEPIWMIGNNYSIDTNTLHLLVTFLKNEIKKYSINDTIIIYGGGVNTYNIKDILNDVDGVLIGSASCDVNHLLKLLEVA